MEKPAKTPSLNEDTVVEYLSAHPDFLNRHPELLALLAPPKQKLGESVVDFQHYQLKALQTSNAELTERHQALVEYCRDGLFLQARAHVAALRLIEARTLEQMLETLSDEIATLFDADVLRIGIEADGDAQSGSMITLLPPGSVEEVLGSQRQGVCISDTSEHYSSGIEALFADCPELAASCIALRLQLPQMQHEGMLVLAVRHTGRFLPGQPIESLMFLSQIASRRLDTFLHDV